MQLSEAIQRSAVELLFHLPSLNDRLLQNIVSCCHGGHLGVSVIQYVLQILYYRFVQQGFWVYEGLHVKGTGAHHLACKGQIFVSGIQDKFSGTIIPQFYLKKKKTP